MRALELADYVEGAHPFSMSIEVACTIRRQHEAIKVLRESLELISETNAIDAALDPQRAVRVAKQALKDTEGLK